MKRTHVPRRPSFWREQHFHSASLQLSHSQKMTKDWFLSPSTTHKNYQKYQNRKDLKFPGVFLHLCEGVHPDHLGNTGRCGDRIMRRIAQLVSRSTTIQLVRGRVPTRQKQGENMSENFTKISASQLPAWKTITFWNIIRARPKNTLLESNLAKKVLIPRKKWNKKGVSFWQ